MVSQTMEEPCHCKDNHLKRFYPVKTSDGRFEKIYKPHQEKAAANDRLVSIGRYGT